MKDVCHTVNTILPDLPVLEYTLSSFVRPVRISPGFISNLHSIDWPAKKLNSPNSNSMSGRDNPVTKILHMVGLLAKLIFSRNHDHRATGDIWGDMGIRI